MNKIEWENPPERRPRRRGPTAVWGELDANPGVWARISTHDKSPNARGRAAYAKKLGYEAVSRRLSDTEWGVWARAREADQ